MKASRDVIVPRAKERKKKKNKKRKEEFNH